MPSGDGGRTGLAWLRSQGLGLVCGLGTVLLLAVGSVILTATRDGASSAVGYDDLRGFFAPPSWVHTWFYLLLGLAVLYAINNLLATWDTVVRLWRTRGTRLGAYAGSVVHLGFLIAMAGHAVGGFTAQDFEPVVVTEAWTELPGFGEVRLLHLEMETMPNHMPKSVQALVAVRGADGEVRTAMVDYNQPLSRGLGSHLALLAEAGRVQVPGLGLRPGILLRPRATPSNPWALVAAVLVGAGVLLMWRRLVRVTSDRTTTSQVPRF